MMFNKSKCPFCKSTEIESIGHITVCGFCGKASENGEAVTMNLGINQILDSDDEGGSEESQRTIKPYPYTFGEPSAASSYAVRPPLSLRSIASPSPAQASQPPISPSGLRQSEIQSIIQPEGMASPMRGIQPPPPYIAEIKKLLYCISPNLHPRIIDSIQWNQHKGYLIINLNKKSSKVFIQNIKQDLGDLVSSCVNETIFLITSAPDKTIELLIQNLRIRAQSKIQIEPEHDKIARRLKEITDKFDYKVISKKPDGARRGVKFEDTYIKSIQLNTEDVLEFFTYVAFHNFLGTKSPQVSLIKEPNGITWMKSLNLSQTYKKDQVHKIKEFNVLKDLPSFKISFSRATPIIDPSGIDLKSIGKLMLLSILFQATDLHVGNVGLVNNKGKFKLAVVDLYIKESHVLTNFSAASSLEDLLKLMLKEFEQINLGIATTIPAVPQLADKLMGNVASFIAAKNAVWFPRSESGLKNKTSPSVVEGHTFFIPRSETFMEVIDKSHKETLDLFKQAGFSSHEIIQFTLPLSSYINKIKENFRALNSVFSLFC